MVKTTEGSMILVNSTFNNQKTFKLIPLTEQAPYIEAIYDRESKVMVIISKQTKTALHMLPKLDEAGLPVAISKGPFTGKQKQERKQIEVFVEYYIEEQSDMKNIIDSLASNPTFKWKDYLKDLPKEEVSTEQ
jgi:hypothetical protein